MFAYPTLLIALALITAAPFGILLAILRKPAASRAATELRRTLGVICGAIVTIAVTASVYNGLGRTMLEQISTAFSMGLTLVIASYAAGWLARWPALGTDIFVASDSYSAMLREYLTKIAYGAPLLAALALICIAAFEGALDTFLIGAQLFAAGGTGILLVDLYHTRENVLADKEIVTAP